MELNPILCEGAEKWLKLKVPFQHRGKTINGSDCTGIVIGILEDAGVISNYHRRKYAKDWNLHGGAGNFILDELVKYSQDVKLKEMKPGDILLFNFGRCAAHLGILIKKNIFVHMLSKAGRCSTASLNNSMWKKRLARIYRLDYERIPEKNKG